MKVGDLVYIRDINHPHVDKRFINRIYKVMEIVKPLHGHLRSKIYSRFKEAECGFVIFNQDICLLTYGDMVRSLITGDQYLYQDNCGDEYENGFRLYSPDRILTPAESYLISHFEIANIDRDVNYISGEVVLTPEECFYLKKFEQFGDISMIPDNLFRLHDLVRDYIILIEGGDSMIFKGKINQREELAKIYTNSSDLMLIEEYFELGLSDVFMVKHNPELAKELLELAKKAKKDKE